MNIEVKTYKKITPEILGNLLTIFFEGDDIMNYESSKTMYVPETFDLTSIREITPEEDAAYKQAREAALQAEAEGDSIVNR